MSLSTTDTEVWMERVHSLRCLEWGETPNEPTQLAPWLFLGGCVGWSIEWLEERGISHVVNVAAKDVKYEMPSSIEVLRVSADDNDNYDLFAHWSEVLRFVRTAPSALLFHCQAGINRSAALALAVYCVGERQPLLPALRNALALRPRILRNRHFQRQLIQCVHEQGLLVHSGTLEFLEAELAAYKQRVEGVFHLFAEGGYAELTGFQRTLVAIGQRSEVHYLQGDTLWDRMAKYRAIVSCDDGQVTLAPRDYACVELWFRSDPIAGELFEDLRKHLDVHSRVTGNNP